MLWWQWRWPSLGPVWCHFKSPWKHMAGGGVYKNISRKVENSGEDAPWMWTALSMGWGPRLNKDEKVDWTPASISLCLLTRDASHSCGGDLPHHDALFANCEPTQTCFVRWLLLGVLPWENWLILMAKSFTYKEDRVLEQIRFIYVKVAGGGDALRSRFTQPDVYTWAFPDLSPRWEESRFSTLKSMVGLVHFPHWYNIWGISINDSVGKWWC